MEFEMTIKVAGVKNEIVRISSEISAAADVIGRKRETGYTRYKKSSFYAGIAAYSLQLAAGTPKPAEYVTLKNVEKIITSAAADLKKIAAYTAAVANELYKPFDDTDLDTVDYLEMVSDCATGAADNMRKCNEYFLAGGNKS